MEDILKKLEAAGIKIRFGARKLLEPAETDNKGFQVTFKIEKQRANKNMEDNKIYTCNYDTPADKLEYQTIELPKPKAQLNMGGFTVNLNHTFTEDQIKHIKDYFGWDVVNFEAPSTDKTKIYDDVFVQINTDLDCSKCPNKPNWDNIQAGDTSCNWCPKRAPWCK